MRWVLSQNKVPQERCDFLLSELAAGSAPRRSHAASTLGGLLQEIEGDKRRKIVRAAAFLAAQGNFSAIRVLGEAGEDAGPFLPLLAGLAERHQGLRDMDRFSAAVDKIVRACTSRQVVTLDARQNASLWKTCKHLLFPSASVLVKLKGDVFAKGKIDEVHFRTAHLRGKRVAFPVFSVALEGSMEKVVSVLEPTIEMWLLKEDIGEWPVWAATSERSVVKTFAPDGGQVKGVVVGRKDDAVLMKVRSEERMWIAEVPFEGIRPCSPPPWGFVFAARVSSLSEGDVVGMKGGAGGLFVVDGFRKGEAVLQQLRCASNKMIVRPQALKYVGRYDPYRGVCKEPCFRSESLSKGAA